MPQRKEKSEFLEFVEPAIDPKQGPVGRGKARKDRIGQPVSDVLAELREDAEINAAFLAISEISDLRRSLKNMREQSGLSQAKIADLMGVHQPVISRIENSLSNRTEIGTVLRFISACGGQLMVHSGTPVQEATNPYPLQPNLQEMYRSVFKTLAEISSATAVPDPRPRPAVVVKKSIFPDYIVCLEDGKKLKMLKRHLKTAYNLSPEEYRERWDLPEDYPMVAPNYAKHRSKLAQKAGLGIKQPKRRKQAI